MEEKMVILEHCHLTFEKKIDILEKEAKDCYKVSNNQRVYIKESLKKEIEQIRKEATPISEILSNEDKQVVKRTIKQLEKEGKIFENRLMPLVQGKSVKTEDIKRVYEIAEELKKDNDGRYKSVHSLSKIYKVPQYKINNAVSFNRLNQNSEGRISQFEFENLYCEDQKKVSLEAVLDKLGKKNKWVYSTGFIKRIKDGVRGKSIKGEYVPAAITLNTDKANTFYMADDEFEIEKYINNHFENMPIENYGYLWSRLDEKTKNILWYALGITPYEINAELQPALHQVMSILLKSGKCFEDWQAGEVQLYLPDLSEKAINLFRRMDDYTKEVRAGRKIINSRMLQSGKDERKYTEWQYMNLGKALFDEEYIFASNMVERAIEDSKVAQALLYMAMNIIAAWRNIDICRIYLGFTIPEIQSTVDEIKKSKKVQENLSKIYLNFSITYTEAVRASKNKGELVFACPIQFYCVMGMYLTIAEYHRLNENRETLLCRKDFHKINIYEDALGEEVYKKLFNDELFSNRQINKSMLQHYVDMAKKLYKNIKIKSLPEFLGSYLRGHKMDYKRGPKSIFHYINLSTDDLNFDEITLSLWLIGTLGLYKSKVARIICDFLDENRDWEITETAELISRLNIDPLVMEKKIDILKTTNNQIKNLERLPQNNEELINKEKFIQALLLGVGERKEKNVFCLFNVIHGNGEHECKGQKYCSGAPNEYGGLCQYAIYSYEYIFELIIRRRACIRKLKELDESYNKGLRSEDIVNQIKRNERVKDNLENTIKNFMGNSEFPKMLREDLYQLYVESESNDYSALPEG